MINRMFAALAIAAALLLTGSPAQADDDTDSYRYLDTPVADTAYYRFL